VKFIKVKSYYRGYSFPPGDYVLNVSQIVSFCQCYFNGNESQEVPYVHLDTTQTRGLAIAGTIDELLAQIKNEEQSK
jgi:hypothetical protein